MSGKHREADGVQYLFVFNCFYCIFPKKIQVNIPTKVKRENVRAQKRKSPALLIVDVSLCHAVDWNKSEDCFVSTSVK